MLEVDIMNCVCCVLVDGLLEKVWKFIACRSKLESKGIEYYIQPKVLHNGASRREKRDSLDLYSL